jgi:hypothetical protein
MKQSNIRRKKSGAGSGTAGNKKRKRLHPIHRRAGAMDLAMRKERYRTLVPSVARVVVR